MIDSDATSSSTRLNCKSAVIGTTGWNKWRFNKSLGPRDDITRTLFNNYTRGHWTVSLAPLQVHYYSDALPTQHGYCVGASRRRTTGNCEWRTCPRFLLGGQSGNRTAILRTKGAESTNGPPRPDDVPAVELQKRMLREIAASEKVYWLTAISLWIS